MFRYMFRSFEQIFLTPIFRKSKCDAKELMEGRYLENLSPPPNLEYFEPN